MDVALGRLRRLRAPAPRSPGSSHLRGPGSGRPESPDMVSTRGGAETRRGWERPRAGSPRTPRVPTESPPPAQGGALESCPAAPLGPGSQNLGFGPLRCTSPHPPGGGEYPVSPWPAPLRGQPAGWAGSLRRPGCGPQIRTDLLTPTPVMNPWRLTGPWYIGERWK